MIGDNWYWSVLGFSEILHKSWFVLLSGYGPDENFFEKRK
jgi:hypothetical protein